MSIKISIKSNLHYARVITPKLVTSGRSHLRARATQLRRKVAAVASRWRNYVDLTDPGFEPQISRTNINVSTTELTGQCKNLLVAFSFYKLGSRTLICPGPCHLLIRPWLKHASRKLAWQGCTTLTIKIHLVNRKI